MGKIADVQEVPVEKLIPYVNNAKIHNENQVTKIASSIREFGFLSPVLIDKQFNIIAGHGRVMAAKKLQMESVPCVFIEGLSEAQRKAYILADNKLGELAEWDMEIVVGEFEELRNMDFDLKVTGFNFPDIQGGNQHRLNGLTGRTGRTQAERKGTQNITSSWTSSNRRKQRTTATRQRSFTMP